MQPTKKPWNATDVFMKITEQNRSSSFLVDGDIRLKIILNTKKHNVILKLLHIIIY